MTAAIENAVAIATTGNAGINALGRMSSGGQGSGGFAGIYASHLASTTSAGFPSRTSSSQTMSSSLAVSSALGGKEPLNRSLNPKDEEKKSLTGASSTSQSAPVQFATQVPVPILMGPTEPVQIIQSTNTSSANAAQSAVLPSTPEIADISPAPSISGYAERSLPPASTFTSKNSSSIDSLGLLTPNEAITPSTKSAHIVTASLPSLSQQPKTDSLPVAGVTANSSNVVGESSLATTRADNNVDVIQNSENLTTLSTDSITPRDGSTAQPSPVQANSVPYANLSMLIDGAVGQITNASSNDTVVPIPYDGLANVLTVPNSDRSSIANANIPAQAVPLAETEAKPLSFHMNYGSSAGQVTSTSIMSNSTPPDFVSENSFPTVPDLVAAPETAPDRPNAPAHALSPATLHISEKFSARSAVEFLNALETVAADAPARFGTGMRANLPASPVLASSHASQATGSSSPLFAATPSTASQTSPEPAQSHAVPATQSANSPKVIEQNAPAGKESQCGKQNADSPSQQKTLTASQTATLSDAPTPPSPTIVANTAVQASANLPAASTPTASTTAGNANADRSTTAPGTPSSPPIAELPAALPAGPVQMAQMVSKAAQSEMRIGLTTPAFGNIEVRAVVHANDVGVLIGSEKGDLRALLTHDLPGIADTLQQQNLRLAQVSFQHGFSFSNQMSSGGESQPRSFSSKMTNPALPIEVAQAGPGELLEDSGAHHAGLSILA